MLKKYTKMFKADITPNSNINLFLGGTYDSSFQYYKDFIYKMNLLYGFWSKGIELKIKYDYPKIGYKNPLEQIGLFIEAWTHTDSRYKKSIQERMNKYISKEKSKILNEEYNILCKFYPTARDLFMQNFTDLSQRGYWRI